MKTELEGHGIRCTGFAPKVHEARANAAFASFVVGVLTEPIPGGKAFDKLGPTASGMATAAADGGKGALTDSVLSEAFPENAYLNPALRAAGAAADASYSDGKAILVQWAMGNGMIEPRLIEQQWGGNSPSVSRPRAWAGTASTPRWPARRCGEFVNANGAAALTDLHLDGKYFEGFTVDPSAKYSQQE